jgi:hypothetical protein
LPKSVELRSVVPDAGDAVVSKDGDIRPPSRLAVGRELTDLGLRRLLLRGDASLERNPSHAEAPSRWTTSGTSAAERRRARVT